MMPERASLRQAKGPPRPRASGSMASPGRRRSPNGTARRAGGRVEGRGGGGAGPAAGEGAPAAPRVGQQGAPGEAQVVERAVALDGGAHRELRGDVPGNEAG